MTLRRSSIVYLFTAACCMFCVQRANAQSDSTPLAVSSAPPFASTQVFNPFLAQPAITLAGKGFVVLNAYAGYVSNTVDVRLLKAAYDNHFITKDELNRVYKRSDNNFVSTNVAVNVGAAWRKDSSRLTHGIYAQWHDSYDFNLSKGLTGLLYFGNAPFENQTAVTNGDLKSVDYKELKYVLSYDASKALKLSGGVGFIQASHAYEAVMKGSVFTATDGDYLDLDYNFDVRTYKTNQWIDFGGKGMTFGASVLYHQPGDKNYVAAGLREAGFLSLPSTGRRYAADTAVTFDGFHIDNVFGLNDSSFVNLDADSVKRMLGVRDGREKFSFGIPAAFFFYYAHRSGSWDFGIESNYAPSVYDLPYAALHAGRRWNRLLFTDVYLHTSTFTAVNVGLSVTMDLRLRNARYLELKLQSGYLNALVAPEKTTGLDGQAEASYRF